jgi:hypothetical protein
MQNILLLSFGPASAGGLFGEGREAALKFNDSQNAGRQNVKTKNEWDKYSVLKS